MLHRREALEFDSKTSIFLRLPPTHSRRQSQEKITSAEEQKRATGITEVYRKNIERLAEGKQTLMMTMD